MLFLRGSEITSSQFWESEITSARALNICTKQHKEHMLFPKGSEIKPAWAPKAARLSTKKHKPQFTPACLRKRNPTKFGYHHKPPLKIGCSRKRNPTEFGYHQKIQKSSQMTPLGGQKSSNDTPGHREPESKSSHRGTQKALKWHPWP